MPEASLARTVLPGNGRAPSPAAVILKVFVPVKNKTGGCGVAFGFLK